MNRTLQVGTDQDRLTINPGSPDSPQRVSPGVNHWKWYPRARRLLFLPPILLLSLIIGLSLGLGAGAPALVMFLGVIIGVPVVWRKPILGAYFLIAAMALVEPFNMLFPDSLTDRIPLHKPLDQLGLPLPVTAIEATMAGMLGLIVLKNITNRKPLLRVGPVFIAMGIFLMFVFYGAARGYGTSGDAVTIVWETRTLFYPILMYLIIHNLITTRAEARQMMWLFLGAVAFKGLIGVFRLIFTLRLDLGSITEVSRANSLMAHEESLFFVAFLVFGLLLFIFNADRQQLKFIAYASFPVALALLANQRRAGILAMVLSITVIFIVVYVQMPNKRRVLIYAAIALFLFSIPYLTLFRNGGGGFIGEPASAVLSTIRPDPRDSGSNEYRVIEGENVGLNIALNPYTGKGFGVPMQILVPLPDLTSIFPLWAYIPHNTVLWIWMRLGILGFAAFWFMVGRMLLSSTMVAGNEKDPYLKAIALLTVTLVMAWVMQGLVDMGIVDNRLNMLVGAMVGLTVAIPALKRSEDETEEAVPDPDPTTEPIMNDGKPIATPRHAALQMSSSGDAVEHRRSDVVTALRFKNRLSLPADDQDQASA